MASAGVMIMTSAAETRSHAVSPLFTPISSLVKVMGPDRCEQRICHERGCRIERRFPWEHRREAGQLRKIIYNKVINNTYMTDCEEGKTGGRRGSGTPLLRQVRSAPSPPGGSCVSSARSAAGLPVVPRLAVLREVQPHHLVLP